MDGSGEALSCLCGEFPGSVKLRVKPRPLYRKLKWSMVAYQKETNPWLKALSNGA